MTTVDKMPQLLKLFMLALLFQTVAGLQQPRAEGGGYDIDCKIILCLPAGFPSGCSDAYSTFISRITSVPPKPPIGFCAMGSVRDIEMHDTHPDRLDVMNSVIGDRSMSRTLRSVKVEYHRSRTTCCRGRECDDEYPCTFTYFINGDGSRFRQRNIEGHHTGSKVLYTDIDGRACVAGNSESWIPPETQCRTWGRDDDSYCWTVRPGYWKRNATCQGGAFGQ